MFLKKKYPSITFNILYFNFRKENIQNTTNILNIVLHSDKYYNTPIGSPYEELRIYCGKILCDLFSTKLIPGYSPLDFID